MERDETGEQSGINGRKLFFLSSTNKKKEKQKA